MPLVLTQSDFRANLTKYLDQVSDDEVIYIIRSNSRLVAFLSQDKLYWMKKALQSKEDSLEYVIARDQLIQRYGYGDCVCFINDNSASVVVSSTENGLSQNDVTKIMEIVKEKTGLTADKITVIETEP